jgi:hypothetical protein
MAGRETRIDRRRRNFLMQALAAGWLAGGSGWNRDALAQVLGRRPQKLPEGKSIFELKGDVQVNGKPATLDTILKPTDTIRTGAGALLIGAVGQDALLLRQNSEVRLNNVAAAGAKKFFRLVTGAMLAVFGPRDRFELQTPTATIGIRGTGVYTEADPEKSYICTCYGLTQISAADDAKATEQIKATHHDNARYVLAKADKGRRIVPAPFINHDDVELMTLEALVGREVPFGIPDSQYERPRREY